MGVIEKLNLASSALAVLLVAIAWIDLRRGIAKIRSAPAARSRSARLGHIPDESPGGYALWIYRAGKWTLERNCSERGYECSGPPARSGWYEGEIVKTEAIAVSGRQR